MQKDQVDVISFTFSFFFNIEIQCNRKLIKSCYSINRGIVLNMQKPFFRPLPESEGISGKTTGVEVNLEHLEGYGGLFTEQNQ